MNARNFFAELKRRNVYKVAVAYAVVGWLLVQVATQVFPFFEVPNWAVRMVVLAIAVGFPISLVIAWAFELTPQGIKRTEDVDPTLAAAAKSHTWIYVALVAALLSIGLFFLGRFTASPKQSKSAAVPEKSIAVLPFDNLSGDPDNAYFTEGVQDEILTRLAKIADLKVISRTSTQHLKSSPENLPEIAQQLGVANILEGSVQKSKDQVRVNVQLIHALTDAHLWADTFDRKLTDIFAVESEIAQKIASSLEAKLTGSERRAMAARPTENAEAYELYLKGRFFWNKRSGSDLLTALDYFQRAYAADPNFAGAHAGAADACLLIPNYSAGRPQEYFQKGKTEARRAIELDENSAEGHTALAALLWVDDMNSAKSEEEFRRAIELNPNYATAHHWYGNTLLVSLGRFAEAIEEGKRAVELDPLSLIINADLGSTLMVARRYDEAITQLRHTLTLDDNFYYAHWNLGEALYYKGDIAGAITEFEKARELDHDPEALALLGRAYAESGKREQALKILDELKEIGRHSYVSPRLFALVHIGLGDKTKAIEDLEMAYQTHANNDLTWIKVDPRMDPLRNDPRFQQLVARVFPDNPR